MVMAMKTSLASPRVHPEGESRISPPPVRHIQFPVDTFWGLIQFEWELKVAVATLGPLPFFMEFLKTGDLFAPGMR